MKSNTFIEKVDDKVAENDFIVHTDINSFRDVCKALMTVAVTDKSTTIEIEFTLVPPMEGRGDRMHNGVIKVEIFAEDGEELFSDIITTDYWKGIYKKVDEVAEWIVESAYTYFAVTSCI